MEFPRISIITPSLNQAPYLEKTICALVEQDYPNLEYIIIDGGSDDNSLEIIQRYSTRLDYWVSEQDGGQSDAINKGFARATGDIITFCNSDDFYLAGTLADVADAFMKSPECGVVVGGFRYIDEQGEYTSDAHMPLLKVKTPCDLTLGPPGIYRLHQAAAFFSRNALDSVGFYVRADLKYVLDRELLYRVARRFCIVTRQKIYAAFRLHRDSKSVSQILPFAEEFALLYEESKSGQPDADRLRQRMANYHRSAGYLRHAKSTEVRRDGALALLQALRYQPDCLGKKSYYKHWLSLLGLR